MRSSYGMSLLAAALLMAVAVPAAKASSGDYEGTLGGSAIGMTLYTLEASGKLLDAGKLRGYYFKEADLEDRQLSGNSDGKRNICLFELDRSGKRTARIEGRFPEHDPPGAKQVLTVDAITGRWSRLDGSESRPLHLLLTGRTGAGPFASRYSTAGVNDAAAFEKKVRSFRAAVLAGDRAAVANAIAYPVNVAVVNGKRRRITSKIQLLKSYDRIFTGQYLDTIKAAVPHNLFARYDGVMLGGAGAVWFDADGKVCALNN